MKENGIGDAALVSTIAIIALSAVAGIYIMEGGDSNGNGGGSFGSPEDTIQTLTDAFEDEDTVAAYNCFSKYSEFTIEKIEDGMNENPENLTFYSVDISNVEITGDSASAEVTTSTNAYGTETSSYEFVKESGEWKINNISGEFTFNTTSYLNYKVTVESSSSTISAPGSTDVSVDVETSVDFSETVTLEATGQPSNVSVSFSPASGVPTFGSTMNVDVGPTTSTGTYLITVKASADNTVKSVSYELSVV